jgi:hypothetical protein
MRTFAALLVAAVLAGAADAQILGVRFKDEKAAQKFKKYTVVLDGEPILIGEPVKDGGILLTYKDGELAGTSYKTNADNDFFVLDPANPLEVPYKVEHGEKVVVKKSALVTIPGKYIESVQVRMRSETIESIAREYKLRLDRIMELEKERDALEKGSQAWVAQHSLLLGAYERLISWLEQNSFSERAEALKKTLATEAKRTAGEAAQVRAGNAQASGHPLAPTDELGKATLAAGGEGLTVKVQESQHVRITYVLPRVTDGEVAELLVFGEKVIEAFRNQFVDPYLSETFKDRIPEGLFQEFYLGPWDVAFHEKFITEYYGLSWGDPKNKARSLELSGSTFTRTMEPRRLDAYRLPDGDDLRGILAHNLGHTLAEYHFNGGLSQMDQPWISEGLGYYLSFEFLGRNSINCKEFRESLYGKTEDNAGTKEIVVGYRDIMTKVALDEGQRIDRVMLKNLADMENSDLAKAWSFVEYLARTGGLEGQLWLRTACELAPARATFMDKLRTFSEGLYGVSGQDVYKVLDDRWRAYAEGQRALAEKAEKAEKG